LPGVGHFAPNPVGPCHRAVEKSSFIVVAPEPVSEALVSFFGSVQQHTQQA
jgi:hypothetical protein